MRSVFKLMMSVQKLQDGTEKIKITHTGTLYSKIDSSFFPIHLTNLICCEKLHVSQYEGIDII